MANKLNPSEPYPVGSRIRFTKLLDKPADSDTPAQVYAYAGEYGRIIGGATKEGYAVVTDRWPHWFGASTDEFEVV